jgi:Ca2+-binding EF-hand superfamily protein
MARSARRHFVLLLGIGAYASAACLAQNVPSNAAGRFAMFDANKDGVVSKSEFNSSAAFNAMDSNNNNRVSADELQAVLGPQESGNMPAADRIARVDMNGDGELTEEELRRGAETRFQWLDRNQDGNVDLSEMQSGFGVPVGYR